MVVEAIHQEKLSYREAARLFKIEGHDRVESRERVYLTEGAEGFRVECCGRGGIYLQTFQSMEHFKAELVESLAYYNNHRSKAKLKGLPPALHRQQALSAS